MLSVTKWKQRKYPYNPNKPKVMRFGANIQPHAKTCVCGVCEAYRRELKRIIGATEYNKRFAPEDAKFFKPKQLPDHVVTRRRLAQTLSRFTF